MNLIVVHFIDVFDVAASFPRRKPLFRDGDHGVRILNVRGPRKGTADGDMEFAWYSRDGHRELSQWPEMRNLIEQIRTRANQIAKDGSQYDVGRVWLEQLGPSKTLPWSEPMIGVYADRLTRVHLPIHTGPQAMLLAGGNALWPQVGQATIINHRVATSAANFNLWPRVHLIIDLLRKEPADALSADLDAAP